MFLSNVTVAFYQYLDLTNITTLLLDKNNILTFETLLARKLPKLEHFDYSYNILATKLLVRRLEVETVEIH